MITIRYQRCNSKGAITIAEKTFKSEKAMISWITRQQETSPSFMNVLAYSKEPA